MTKNAKRTWRMPALDRESSLSYELICEEHRLVDLRRCVSNAIVHLKARNVISAYESLQSLDGAVDMLLRHSDRIPLANEIEQLENDR